MKKTRMKISLIIISILLLNINCKSQNPVNWTDKQLIEPATLANMIKLKKDLTIISIGPAATIPGSLDNGMVNNKAGLDKLKLALKNLPRNKKIVVYCGCCPYEHCPNVRPAIDVLNEMKFTNFFLLDLPHNIRKDWIDKGFPVSGS
jgi:hypothetical protein